VPGALGHILIASMMSLPAAILIARIMIPGEAGVATESASDLKYRSSMDAIARHRGRPQNLSSDPRHAAGDGCAGVAGRHDPAEPALGVGCAAFAGARLRLAVRAG